MVKMFIIKCKSYILMLEEYIYYSLISVESELKGKVNVYLTIKKMKLLKLSKICFKKKLEMLG